MPNKKMLVQLRSPAKIKLINMSVDWRSWRSWRESSQEAPECRSSPDHLGAVQKVHFWTADNCPELSGLWGLQFHRTSKLTVYIVGGRDSLSRLKNSARTGNKTAHFHQVQSRCTAVRHNLWVFVHQCGQRGVACWTISSQS